MVTRRDTPAARKWELREGHKSNEIAASNVPMSKEYNLRDFIDGLVNAEFDFPDLFARVTVRKKLEFIGSGVREPCWDPKDYASVAEHILRTFLGIEFLHGGKSLESGID
jgi:hypothetical protein